jgi:hypothetical protein
MSEPRICPECGADIYRASHYDEMMEAKHRVERKAHEQAVEILRLQLRVAELVDGERRRHRKVELQRRTIRRLEAKVREAGLFPHDDRGDEGDPASHAPKMRTDTATRDPAVDGPSPRGLLGMRKRAAAQVRRT